MDFETLLGDSNISFLLKFVEPQFVDSTMNGNFYFARNQYFIELEDKELNEGIADKYEGSWSFLLKETDQVLFEIENERLVLPITPNVIHTRLNCTSQIPICCFVHLSIRNDFEIVPNTNKLRLKICIEEQLRKQFVGRHMVVITDMWNLIKRIKKASKGNGYQVVSSIVEYYDEQNEPHPLSEEKYNEYPASSLFYKSKFFEHQREYRFILGLSSEKDITLQIGNINDIACDNGIVNLEKELRLDLEFVK